MGSTLGPLFALASVGFPPVNGQPISDADATVVKDLEALLITLAWTTFSTATAVGLGALRSRQHKPD
jgi:hypothetical protein